MGREVIVAERCQEVPAATLDVGFGTGELFVHTLPLVPVILGDPAIGSRATSRGDRGGHGCSGRQAGVVAPSGFPGGPGRTTSPADFTSLMDDLEARIFPLPDDTWFYPGHGKDSTLGAERPRLGEWRARLVIDGFPASPADHEQ